ncbi:MAG: PDR/VanB family oxidoreductase [Candidatus Thiodiazotropha sp.]
MLDVVVVKKTRETEDIVSLELARPDGLALPAFEPGAHIDVHLPNGLLRQYSLCNHPGETHRYLIAVLKEPDSRGGSVALHEQVEVDDRLQISEPRNLFPMAEHAERTLLFAGGIGITPLLGMAHALSDAKADFELHYSARSRNGMAFAERIMDSAFADRVTFHISAEGQSHRLDADALLATPRPGTHLYVCGPARFMDYVLDSAKANGWPSEQVHREYFSAAPVDHTQDGSFEVEIKSTGEVIAIPADRSALHVLEEAGFDIPMSCEEGVCGTCLTRVLAGEPDHRDLFMTDEEHALNDQFTPCCSRARSGRLLLDL